MMSRFLVRPLALVTLATLIGCAAPEVRPEWGVINFPVEEVWQTFVELTKEWDYTLEAVDSSKHVIKAAKQSTSVIGTTVSSYERFGKATREQHHVLRVSMKPRGDQSTLIEIVYLIDKVPDEEAGFALLNAVRDRL
ncbi:MAG: hypothetical protein ACREJ6_02630, partial [Candidatus Methylomirabilis sp.]